MTFMIEHKNIVLASLGILLALIGSVTVITLSASDPPTASERILSARGVAEAEGRNQGDEDTVAFFVNGVPVSTAEFYEAKARTKNSIDEWADKFNRAVPDGHPSLQEIGTTPTLEQLNDGVSPIPLSLIKALKPDFDLWNKYGVEIVTLGNLISDTAFVAAALNGGFAPSEAELAEYISDTREQHETVVEGETSYTDPDTNVTHTQTTSRNHDFDAYVETLGPERFWDEIAPRVGRRYLAKMNWRGDALSNAGAFRDDATRSTVRNAQYQISKSALNDVQVRYTGAIELEDSTAARAISYLDEWLAMRWGIGTN